MRALLLALLILLATQAAAAPLKITTWNLEWLTLRPPGDPALPRDVIPRHPGDLARLAAYAAILNADVIAFEEVDGPQAAAQIFPPDRYTVHMTNDPVIQRVGLAIRRTIPFTINPDDTALDVYGPTAPHPLRSGADVTLTLPGGQHLRLLAIHLKSGCQTEPLQSRPPACTALRAQIPVLQAWIAAREAEDTPYAILGDFNRVMDANDPLFAALFATAPLLRTTEGLADPCWGGENFIDHILLGGDAMSWLEPDSLRVLVYKETTQDWKTRLSDHCPVSVRLDPPG
jgi:endonuclease/exonuclease/phosphatase family metal-dependent hydrolase